MEGAKVSIRSTEIDGLTVFSDGETFVARLRIVVRKTTERGLWQIQALTGTSVTAVKLRAHRAYEALRAVFREAGEAS